MARAYFAGKNPVGRKFSRSRDRSPVTAQIVGVVRDIRHYGLRDQAGPAVYIPITEMEPPWAPASRSGLASDLASASRDIDRTMASHRSALLRLDLRTMDQHINAYLEKERMLATVASLVVRRAAACSGGIVRRDGLCRRAQDERDRIAHGARSASGARCWT